MSNDDKANSAARLCSPSSLKPGDRVRVLYSACSLDIGKTGTVDRISDLAPSVFCVRLDDPRGWKSVTVEGTADKFERLGIHRQERLARVAEGLAKIGELVPVSERLPEPLVEVLAYSSGLGFVFGEVVNLDGVWYDNSTMEPVRDVTHWMPLPEPPQ